MPRTLLAAEAEYFVRYTSAGFLALVIRPLLNGQVSNYSNGSGERFNSRASRAADLETNREFSHVLHRPRSTYFPLKCNKDGTSGKSNPKQTTNQ